MTTESSAITELINSVRSQPIDGGGGRPHLLVRNAPAAAAPPPALRAEALPAGRAEAPPPRPKARGTVPPPVPKVAASPPRPRTVPPPIPPKVRAALAEDARIPALIDDTVPSPRLAAEELEEETRPRERVDLEELEELDELEIVEDEPLAVAPLPVAPVAEPLPVAPVAEPLPIAPLPPLPRAREASRTEIVVPLAAAPEWRDEAVEADPAPSPRWRWPLVAAGAAVLGCAAAVAVYVGMTGTTVSSAPAGGAGALAAGAFAAEGDERAEPPAAAVAPTIVAVPLEEPGSAAPVADDQAAPTIVAVPLEEPAEADAKELVAQAPLGKAPSTPVVTPLAPSAVEPATPAPSADRETPDEASERREARRARRERREARRERREQQTGASAVAAVAERGAPKAGAEGVLMLGAKPPCEIHINGRNTGLVTPQREIALPAGRHTVTLINREHRIRTSFPVRIEAGKPVRVVKDLTDQLR